MYRSTVVESSLNITIYLSPSNIIEHPLEFQISASGAFNHGRFDIPALSLAPSFKPLEIPARAACLGQAEAFPAHILQEASNARNPMSTS